MASQRRKMSLVQKYRLKLDQIAEQVAREDDSHIHDANFGGRVHTRFREWWMTEPHEDNSWRQTYAEVHAWDKAKKPTMAKSSGQGVLGFYIPDGHLPCDVNNPGARILFKECGPQQWDGWWEWETKEHEIQERAWNSKEDIYWQVRGAWRGANDKMHSMMTEVFGWTEYMDADEGDEQDEAAD